MTKLIYSQQVDWWRVHEYVSPVLNEARQWPMAGTIAWCELEDDPRKLAALFDAAQHHILRVDTAQNAVCQAGEAVSAAADWSTIARVKYDRAMFEAAHPWMKRGAA